MRSFNERMKARGQGGFTLIELLVVIAILAVLGGAVIIGIGAMRGNAEEQVCKTNRETLEVAAEAFRLDSPTNAYPADTAALVTAGLIKNNTIPAGQVFGINGTNGEVTLTSATGWTPAQVTACNS